MSYTRFYATAAIAACFTASHASADDMASIRAEMEAMRGAYEARMQAMEAKLREMEAQKAASVPAAGVQATEKPATAARPAGQQRAVRDNAFNPSVGVILNGQYRNFSREEGDIAGFAVGHEGERSKEGFAVDHTELNFTANADDKFRGSVTAAIADHEGETEIELEEAFLQTLPGAPLPDGMSVKAGRAFWTFGYLNEHHGHADDFADRPLPYRVFLDGGFNDDGAEISYVLPTDFYAEIGGGAFRGDDFPFGGADGEGAGAYSGYARVGGDVGTRHSWRAGLSALTGDTGREGRESNEEMVMFNGDTNLYAADIRYVFAPTANPRDREVSFQAEYFIRDEDGTYEDTDAGTGAVPFSDTSSGWYAQGVYKFLPQWRVGARYARLEAPETPAGLAGSALDAGGHDPYAATVMADYTNSEFGRLRMQYSYEEGADGAEDHQTTLQYILSLGAHAAHKY